MSFVEVMEIETSSFNVSPSTPRNLPSTNSPRPMGFAIRVWTVRFSISLKNSCAVAVTATAAYQLKEEKTKGTLEPGKLADLVILAGNPLKVERTTIKDIAVVETVKEGRTVYRR